MIKNVTGGVCAAKGFLASGIRCGIRKNKSKKDLSLIFSQFPAQAAAVYTTNLVKGAPLTVTKRHLAQGSARAVICNSGNANTCNANGEQVAEEMCALTAQALSLSPDEIVVASTGVIGQPLDISSIAAGIPALVQELSADGSDSAAEGIMTTDTVLKSVAVEFELGGKTCRLGGIAKGSGMIHPNMATMLIFLTTDAAVSASALQTILSRDVADSFNMISVDGDTSTNDMVVLLANGAAENQPVADADSPEGEIFAQALKTVTVQLCRKIAADGEGATKLLECVVTGAESKAAAKIIAKSVICSSLLKAAMFGADANWGRVLCAIGYSGAKVHVDRVCVGFESAAGRILVCRGGAGVAFSEETAKKILTEPEIIIRVSLGDGDGAATAWGCDLTYDYVKINGDYRT